jgi:L-lysine exporter family protein LysE/ArgO
MGVILLRGLILGFIAGLPLGPASATVVDTAMRHSRRKAIAVGVGAALVDFVYCLLVVAGFGQVFRDDTSLANLFMFIGGAVLIVFGIATTRTKPIDPVDMEVKRTVSGRTLLAACGTGILVSVVNPALIVSWVLLAGTVLAGLDLTEAVVAGTGVFVGVLVWFIAISVLAKRGRFMLGQKAVWITRGAGILLAGYGCYLVWSIGLAFALGI